MKTSGLAFAKMRKYPFQQAGFTLLELVLVLFIVALIATTPLLFIDNQDNQIRYDETLQKMQMIRDAIIQRQEYRNQPVLSGFVIDNGVLPNGIDALISNSENWQSVSQSKPYFKIDDISPSSTQLTNIKILKGHKGSYINKGIDSNNELRDGWGEPFNVALSTDTNGFTKYEVGFTSTQPLITGSSEAISAYDWQVPLSELDIVLINTSEAEMSSPKPLALLVFKNSDSLSLEDNWFTYHFTAPLIPAASEAIPDNNYYSPSDNEWFFSGTPIADASTVLIPAGDHLLVYDPENNASPHKFVRVIPGSTQPTVTLLVSPE